MKKIVCFSDVHGEYRNECLTDWLQDNPGDILIFAGDYRGGWEEVDEGKNFLGWMSELPYKYKVLVFGNHDISYEDVLDTAKTYPDIMVLNHESANVDGINMFGSPYSVEYGNWPFMEPEKKLSELYKAIPDDTEILITHGPAFGILDMTRRGALAGSTSLLSRISHLPRLKYHICGHIHEQNGSVRVGKVQHINVSVLDEEYRLSHWPTIIEYKNQQKRGSSLTKRRFYGVQNDRT
jgi:Icc-related predicted phosphoesterase